MPLDWPDKFSLSHMASLSWSLSTGCWGLDWEPLTGKRRNHLLQTHSLDLVPSRGTNNVIKTCALFLCFNFFFLCVVFTLHITHSYVPTRSPAESRRCLVPPQNCRVKQEVGPGLLKGPHFPTSLIEKCQWTNKSSCSSPLWSPLNHVSNHPRPLVCLWTIWTQLFLLPRTQSLYQVLHFCIISSVQCLSFPTARRA